MTPERFWSYIARGTGCWLWTRRVGSDGYGLVTWNYRLIAAHRVAYALARGPIPAGMVVMHSCDVRACCNPAHLSLGSIADNNADMARKGRARTLPKIGTNNPNAKLTTDLVVELRRARRAGESLKSICKRTGLSPGTISPMLNGKTWRHVMDAAEGLAMLRAADPDEYALRLASEGDADQ